MQGEFWVVKVAWTPQASSKLKYHHNRLHLFDLGTVIEATFYILAKKAKQQPYASSTG